MINGGLRHFLGKGNRKLFLNPVIKRFADKPTNSDYDKLKQDLTQEKKGFINKLSDYFIKTKVVNHTGRDLDLNKISAEFEGIRKADKSEDLKNVENFFKLQSRSMSKMKVDEGVIEEMLEIVKDIKDPSLFFNDKRYNLFVDDTLFIVNACKNPKSIPKLFNLGVLIKDPAIFKEFQENLSEVVWNHLEGLELEDLLKCMSFLLSSKNDVIFARLAEPFKAEAVRRLDKDFYKKSRKAYFLEPEDIVKILLTYQKFNLLDEEVIAVVFKNVLENIDGFSLKDIGDIVLFFADLDGERTLALKFFEEMYEKKIRRNIKIMSPENLYNYLYSYYKYKNLNESRLNSIIDALLQNDSINKDLNEYLLFQGGKGKIVTKFVYLLDLINPGYQSSKEKVDKLMDLVLEYFLENKTAFEGEDVFTIIKILSKKKLLDETLVKEILANYVNRKDIDAKMVINIANFYARDNIKLDKKLQKDLENLMKKSTDLKTNIQTLILYIRLNIEEGLNSENLTLVQERYKTIKNLTFDMKMTLKEYCQFLWVLSYFTKYEALDKSLIKAILGVISSSQNFDTITSFELLTLIHAITKFSEFNKEDVEFQESVRDVLVSSEPTVIKLLKDLTALDFLATLYIFSKFDVGSATLIEEFSQIIIGSVDQFNFFDLEIIMLSFNQYKNLSKLGQRVLEVVNRLKLLMDRKLIEKSAQSADDELLKECIREVMEEESANKHKKLI